MIWFTKNNKAFNEFTDYWHRPVINNHSWTKSDSLPVFINKLLLSQSLNHLFVYFPWLLLCYKAELSSYNKDHTPARPKIFIIWPFTEQFANCWHRYIHN